MITKLTAITLTIFLLSSCKTKLICRQVINAEIKPLPLCDISLQFNECYCRCFDLNNWQEVADNACKWKYGSFKKGSYPLKTCEGLAGFFLEDMAQEVKPKVKKLSKIKSDYCR